MNTQQYKLIDAPVPVKTIKNAENRHLTAIEKKAIRAGMNQGVACFKSGRKIYTISHIDTNHYCVEIEEKETTIFNRLETVSRKVPFSVRLEKAKDEVKEKSIEQIEAEQLELILTQEKSIETKEETQEVIDNPVIETVEEPKKEINNPVIETIQETKKETIDNTVVEIAKEVAPQNKVAKLQIKLTRLNAQLSVTKGNHNKAKIVIEILKVESAIEQLIPEEKEITLTREQEKSLNALTGGKFIFSKLTQESKKELLKIVNELEDLERKKYRDDCTGKGLWKRPNEASIKRSEKRSNKYSLLRERVEQLELIQENPVEVKDITVKIPVSVSTLKKHCKVPSFELTDEEIINGWKYSLAAQSMQRDFRTQKDIQWADRHLLLNIVYWIDQYQQEMDRRGLTEKYCLWIEKKQAFKDEFCKKPVDAPVTKKDEFCKKPDRKTIKLLESRFKDAQIDITETQVILKSETSELTMNCSMELPELDYRRRDVIKSLIRQNQNPKIHSVYEYIGSILLTA